jgi:putative membrane protein
MQRLAAYAGRPRNRLAGWFWGLLGAIVAAFGSLALWAAVDAVLARSPLLATLLGALLAAFGVVCAAIVLRESLAFVRLSRLDRFQHAAAQALADHDLASARRVADDLVAFYGGRPELKWRHDEVQARLDTTFDADAVLGLMETDILAPLDAEARLRVEAAARQVATVTAIVPLALADVVAALTANLRMIRAVAEVYGGRAGTFGTWRLMRSVMAHLVATGAVAVGDDLIHSVAGGSVLSRISRRFGEGVVNGALTARVGVAAIEVCRPLPFRALKRPSVSGLVKRALAGLFPGGT